MSKEDLKVKPVDQDVANEDLKDVTGGHQRVCGVKDEREKKGCGSRD